MPHARRFIAAVSLALVPFLAGCVPAVLVTGAAAGIVSAHDRRSTGVQADDEVSEWKGANRLPARYADSAHVNFTAFNRSLLVTGEVPDEAARRAVGDVAAGIEGITRVFNEVVVGPVSARSSRGRDALVSATFKVRALDARSLSVNHVKPVCENGVLFLLGLVNAHEAGEAIWIARTTDGVREVVNLLEVIPAAETRRLDAMYSGPGRDSARADASPAIP